MLLDNDWSPAFKEGLYYIITSVVKVSLPFVIWPNAYLLWAFYNILFKEKACDTK